MKLRKSCVAAIVFAGMALMTTLNCEDEDKQFSRINWAPVIEGVVLSLNGTVISEDNYDNIPGGHVIDMQCWASDPDNDSLDISWSASVGTFSSNVGQAVQWTAPDADGSAEVVISVTDGPLTTEDTLVLGILQNTLPVIESSFITYSGVDTLPPSMWDVIPTGYRLGLNFEITDATDDQLTLTWLPPVNRGFTINQPVDGIIYWSTPDTCSTIDIILEVTDGVGMVADTMQIHVLPYLRGEVSDFGIAVTATADGGYAIAGATNTATADGFDGLLIKTDAKGHLQWQKTYGGAAFDSFEAIITTDDGGYVMAGWTISSGAGGGDMWVIKTDAAGNIEWEETYGGEENDWALGLTSATGGGYAVVGFASSFGAGDQDVYIVRIDSEGGLIWSNTFGDSYNDVAWEVAETEDGGFVLAGELGTADFTHPYGYVVRVDEEGNYVWDQSYGGARQDIFVSVLADADDTFVLAGFTESAGAGGSDAWLVKIEGDGNVIWDVTHGGAGDERAMAAVPTPNGGFVLAGVAAFGTVASDALFIQTDANGSLLAYNTLGGPAEEVAWSLCRTATGIYAMTGWTESFDAQLQDIFLFRVDDDGEIVD